jgi:hypothetical protein
LLFVIVLAIQARFSIQSCVCYRQLQASSYAGVVVFVEQTWGFILSPGRGVQPLIRPLSWSIHGQVRNTVVFRRSFDFSKRTTTKQKDDSDGKVGNNRNEDGILSNQSQQAASASEFVQPIDATVSLKRKARFTIPETTPKFVWQPP